VANRIAREDEFARTPPDTDDGKPPVLTVVDLDKPGDPGDEKVSRSLREPPVASMHGTDQMLSRAWLLDPIQTNVESHTYSNGGGARAALTAEPYKLQTCANTS
jgi:hypothetical protein